MQRRPHFQIESMLQKQGYKHVCGIDEVGRGAWAGPLVLAGVILPKGIRLPGLTDSKLLSAKKREGLAKKIREKAIAYRIVEISSEIIDTIKIQEAWKKGVFEIIEALTPDCLVIDGRPVKGFPVQTHTIIKGDSKVRSIAAASIIAKVYRDALMIKMAEHYPHYGFESHKGYGTKFHQNSLKQYGACKIHRRSYKPISFF